MCLYSREIRNPRYRANKSNNYTPPACDDKRKLYVSIGCGNCIECRKQKQREWQVRLAEEIKHNHTGKFITLTFSEEELTKLEKETKENEANIVAGIAIRRFLERWRKEHKKSVKHWLVTELGHTGTERIHLHGILFTEEEEEKISRIWKYGRIHIGYEVSMRSINYLIKYITKTDQDHEGFKGKIFTSKGIGKKYMEGYNKNNNKYTPNKTDESYKLPNGVKTALPMYYRKKLYTDEEREKLWIEKLDAKTAYVMGQKIKNIDTEQGLKELEDAIKHARIISRNKGYGEGRTKKKKFLTKNNKKICI